MPWTLPLGVVAGVLRSPCASNHGAAPRGEPAERAERDRVVVAEDDRDPVVVERRADELGDPFARRSDRRQEARARVVLGRRLRDGGGDVPAIHAVHAERGEPLLEPRVLDRRGTHVDAPPAGSQVERAPMRAGFMRAGLHDRGIRVTPAR
jgi:hypothetical protein